MRKAAPIAIEHLKDELQQLVAKTDVKHLPAYAPIHEGRLVASLDKIQDAKRTLGPNDHLSIETEGKVYEVDLARTWAPDEIIPVSDSSEKHSEGVVILTIRKPDLLGNAKWQFAHGTAAVNASIKDDRWLNRFHTGKIALHSGDALKCKVRFTYVFDTTGKMIEQKTDVLKVLRILRGPGSQDDLFEE